MTGHVINNIFMQVIESISTGCRERALIRVDSESCFAVFFVFNLIVDAYSWQAACAAANPAGCKSNRITFVHKTEAA
jgi:hypothetical protein